MSHESYIKWWITSKRQLEDLQIRDNIMKNTTKPTKVRSIANHLAGRLYARYALIVQDLSACLDQTCQVQKRFTMRKLVEAATMRLNELKEELVNINMSEYHYIDGNLIELKIVPQQVEILDPALILHRTIDIEDMWIKIKNGEKIYIPPSPPATPTQRLSNVETQTGDVGDSQSQPTEPPAGDEGGAGQQGEAQTETEEQQPSQAGKKKQQQIKPPTQKYVPPVVVQSPEEIAEMERQEIVTQVITLIQIHERARQCRLYYAELDQRHELQRKAADGTLRPDAEPVLQEFAATQIQRVWRGHADRECLRKRELDRRLLIGMIEPSWRSTKEQDKVKKTVEERRALRDQHIREYVQANLEEKARVLRVIGPGLMEDIGDEIREWFYQWYIRAKNFDKYPPEEKGGSILIVRCETFTPEEWLDDVEKKRKEKEKLKGMGKDALKAQKEKQKKEAAERKKKELEKKKKAAAEAKKKKKEFEFKFVDSAAMPRFQEGFKEYKDIWDEKDDALNPLQTHYMDMITEDKCYEMQLEVRPLVDELMRLELDMLNEALENDKWKAKGKKGKAKPKKKGKGKKKGKKGKKKKDPTGNRSTEDLFQELVDNGIIHTYPEAHLRDFIGDFSYQNWDKRNLDFDPPATLGDVRQLVMLNCILPLGVGTMGKPKSVLIAGHRQSGKHLLANAIFYETQCVLFDLSPPILAGKYPGKKEMKMLVHLINKMSRILQPSIIFIDGGEKPFYKKVPKPEKELEPKKMGKQLFKGIIKPITAEDRVLVLAITAQPFAAQAKGLKKAFERVILIPRTDYGSVYLYWRELLMPYHAIDRNLSVSEVAKLSVTYPLPILKEVCEKVLAPDRLIQLKFRPLDAHEIIEALLDAPEPILDKEWNKFQKWFKKTPLAKKRNAYIKIAEEIREAEAKAAEKAKAKK